MAGADATKTRGPWPQLERVEAICYSGYREGQSPATRKYPTEAQVLEDLRLLAPRFRHLRMYDCSPHVQTTLALIQKHKLPFKVMIGAYLEAEASNPKCPWGGVYEEDVLVRNRRENQVQLAKAIMLANKYPEIVSSVSAGNEATVEWTDHLVPVEHVIQYVRTLKAGVKQPVTFCENYVPWQSFLAPLVAEVDFISLHTYPEWEQKGMDTALSFTEENFDSVAKKYPGKKVVITEAGWATRSSGRGIPVANANEAFQKQYIEELTAWSVKRGILTFLFEAFDEPWKGSEHPDEPEKHWGLYTVDRKPKPVLRPAP
ncbi:MAG: glycosyl hydrolase family 17 protein [Myxococcales bacterium]|nr:glycosyl hydrolase family 17 protein [Myxococcales bacterium]MDP3504647.1 glycosyl hydrolase family 17 protein [Myxococcales bacterium]